MPGSIVLTSLLAFGGSLTPIHFPIAAVSVATQEPEGPADQVDSAETTAEGDGAAKPAAPAEPTPAAATPEATPTRYSQWHLLIAPGIGYVRGPNKAYSAIGPGGRFGAWKLSWRKNFVIGGGPSIVYSYLFDKLGQDRLHFFTVNGDFVVGGGKADKFAAYAHLTLGGGVIAAKDGVTGSSFILPGIRAAAGFGIHGYLTRRLSLGTLVNFGYMGGLGVDAFLTLGVHFGKKPK